MNETECMLLSVILNLAVDGKADLSKLSPDVADFVEGSLEDYQEESDEESEELYWYAHNVLSKLSTRKVH
jgi:hypothetical protein